jgi:hypothetical protein
MSAIGTKHISLFAPHMSAFGGKADIEKVNLPSPACRPGKRFMRCRHRAWLLNRRDNLRAALSPHRVVNKMRTYFHPAIKLLIEAPWPTTPPSGGNMTRPKMTGSTLRERNRCQFPKSECSYGMRLRSIAASKARGLSPCRGTETSESNAARTQHCRFNWPSLVATSDTQARIAATRLFVLHTGDRHKGHAAYLFEPLRLDGALRPPPI